LLPNLDPDRGDISKGAKGLDSDEIDQEVEKEEEEILSFPPTAKVCLAVVSKLTIQVVDNDGEEVNPIDHMDPFRVNGDLAKIPFPPVETHDITLSNQEEPCWLPGLKAAIDIGKAQINKLMGQKDGKRGIAYWESYIYDRLGRDHEPRRGHGGRLLGGLFFWMHGARPLRQLVPLQKGHLKSERSHPRRQVLHKSTFVRRCRY